MDSPYLCLLNARVAGVYCCCAQLFTWVLGIGTQVLLLVRQAFYLASPPAQQFALWCHSWIQILALASPCCISLTLNCFLGLSFRAPGISCMWGWCRWDLEKLKTDAGGPCRALCNRKHHSVPISSSSLYPHDQEL